MIRLMWVYMSLTFSVNVYFLFENSKGHQGILELYKATPNLLVFVAD